MTAAGRFGVALGVGVVLMGALGVAVALSYHPVRPRILCAMPLGTGGQAVYFGYYNESPEPVLEPLGDSNFAVPAGEPVTTFLSGSSGGYPAAAFVVNAPAGAEVAWTVGPRTARLDEHTVRCPIPALPPPPLDDVVWVKPKPAPIEIVEPEPEPAPVVEPVVDAKPPPKLIERVRPKPKDVIKEPPTPKPVALALSSLTNLDSGIAIQKGDIDTLGDASLIVDNDNDKPPADIGALDGIEGGVAVAPAREPKRVAARVKVRPRGEWPLDAPPRAGAVLVRLSLLVGKDGKVKQVKVVRGAGPAFDREARAIGLRATFSPATLDGAPVESWVPWDVEFTPDDF